MNILDHNPLIVNCDGCGADQTGDRKVIVELVPGDHPNPDKRCIAVCKCQECGRRYWHHVSRTLLGYYGDIKDKKCT